MRRTLCAAANLGAARVFSSCLALRAITPSQLAIEGDAQLARLIDEVDDTIQMLKAHVAAHDDERLPEHKVRVARH